MYAKVIATLKELEMSRHKLAIKCGISPSDLYSALAGNKPMYPGWRKKIADALGASEQELFEIEEGDEEECQG